MKLSYIIPAYNAIETIGHTLDSIFAISLEENDYEVIVVDDCSNDNTCDLVEQYYQKHSNLRLLRQPENHRQGAARNRGLEIAQGEYITYIDADDLVLDGIVDILKMAKESKADMVYGYMEIESTEGMVIHQLHEIPPMVMSGIDFAEAYQHEGVFYFPPSFLYRRDFLISIRHPFIEDRQHEDRDWLASVLVKARSVVVCPKTTYRYVSNPNSTCRKPRYSTIFDHVASGIRHIDLAQQLKSDCPKLSVTLYAFGVEEIHHSIRLRNLTKYTWSDNKNLYDEQHLKPLMSDLKRICKSNPMPREVRIVAYSPLLTKVTVFIGSPIASLIRKLKHAD